MEEKIIKTEVIEDIINIQGEEFPITYTIEHVERKI